MKTTQEERRLIDFIRECIIRKTSRTIDVPCYGRFYYDLEEECSMIACDKFKDQSDERYEYQEALESRIDEFIRFVALKECPNAKVVTIYYKDVNGAQYDFPTKILRNN